MFCLRVKTDTNQFVEWLIAKLFRYCGLIGTLYVINLHCKRMGHAFISQGQFIGTR